MDYIQLNKNWNAEPNAPALKLTATQEDVTLTFDLNPFLFDYIDEGDQGQLVFENVHAYRLDPTNDEGYMRGQFRYSDKELPWGEFYELPESNWSNDIPADRIELMKLDSLEAPTHFIFFFRDHTFECIADDYTFSYLSSDLEALDALYPNGYMDHFLNMLVANHQPVERNSLEAYCKLYLSFEGQGGFAKLKEETKMIKHYGSEKAFVKLANSIGFDSFGMDEMNLILTTVEQYSA